MQNDERNSLIAWRLFGLTFGLFCLWFLFSWTGPVRHAETAIINILPGWFVAGNLLLVPLLMAAASGGWRVPSSVRLVLGALMFWSILVFVICFKKYLLASCVVLVLLLLEAYWIIPKWNAGRK